MEYSPNNKGSQNVSNSPIENQLTYNFPFEGGWLTQSILKIVYLTLEDFLNMYNCLML